MHDKTPGKRNIWVHIPPGSHERGNNKEVRVQYTIELHLGENGKPASVRKEEFEGSLEGAISCLRKLELETIETQKAVKGIVYNGQIEIQVFNYEKK